MSKDSQTTPDYRKILLDFAASLTLCDHMGDVCDDLQKVMDLIGVECDVDLSEGSKGPFKKILRGLGAKTLYGTDIGSDEDDEQ
jgi:hypothetical protein